MKKKIIVLVGVTMGLTIIGLGTSGCAGVRGVARELKGDNSTVVHHINTIYGTSKFIRANPTTNQSVTISPDGTVTINQRQ